MKLYIGETLGLYERNFHRLMDLIPDFGRVEESCSIVSRVIDGFDLWLHVVERRKYTTTITLSYRLAQQYALITDPYVKIRLYHDAKLAEIIGYQNEAKFLPKYAYPNHKMFQPSEKRHVNLFLTDLLRHCLAQGHCFIPEGVLTKA